MQISNVVKSTTKSVLEVQSSFWFDKVTLDFLDSLYYSYQRQYSETRNEMPFTEEEFRKYGISLAALRILSFNSSIYSYVDSPNELMIPSMLYLPLGAIGPVYYDQFGVKIVPVLSSDEKKTLKVADKAMLLKVSRGLVQLARHVTTGIERGLPSNKVGELTFMLTTAEGNETIFGEVKTDDATLAFASIYPHAAESKPRFFEGVMRDASLKSLMSMLP